MTGRCEPYHLLLLDITLPDGSGVFPCYKKLQNLPLKDIHVSTVTNQVKNTQTILSGLTSGLGWLVGGLVDILVGVLTIGQVKLNLQDLLSGLLNARAAEPTIFATGSFAGRIVGDVNITDCIVTGNVSVSNVNGRTGGFVGYTEGVTQYDGLSDALGLTVNVLSSLLNAIPGLGLGDLITVLLENALPLGSLIPTGYINPRLSGCSVSGLSNTIGAADKNYNGGFVGQQVGTVIENCMVSDSNYTVQAQEYGGGFAGVSRDAEIKGLLSEVGVELLRVMQPQSILMNCSISNSTYSVTGGSYLGGFIGAQTNSYAVDDSVDGTNTTVSVTATGNNAGGFAGIATLGWITNLGKDEVKDSSLLSVVKELLLGLLSPNDQEQSAETGMLLSLTGVSPSAILGCQIHAADVQVRVDGSFAGGFIGKGDGVYLADSSAEYLEKLSYWKYDAYTSYPQERKSFLTGLNGVAAQDKNAGGIAGLVGTASVGGLLNETIGVGGFLGFTVQGVSVTGVGGGYSVSAGENYAGGAIGEAVGGNISSVQIQNLKSVTAQNSAGGFVGCAGPGDLAGTGGLKLSLLGLNILELNGLLSVAQGVVVEITDSDVTGIQEGFTVETTGKNAAGEVTEFIAGGFIGKNSSTKITNASAVSLKSVTADNTDGFAGGFAETSRTGGLAEVSDESSIGSMIKAGNLVSAVGYLIPSYKTCTVTYVDGGGVQADTAGGFVADFQSGKVNNQEKGEGDYYAVYNLDFVKGQSYAGGFGGKVYSGALASANNGGLSILGGVTDVSLNINQLLSLVDAYVPFIQYAGVKAENGFTVEATKTDDMDTMAGSAGGYIGYGSGVQISYCDVTKLKHTTVKPPDNLEAVQADEYFDRTQSAYAVTGARYAGGYIGKMDVGDAASLGSGLKILGQTISLNNVLSALSVVVSTIEHSTVMGAAGGFAVLASDTSGEAVGMSGGFAGNISGGHIQDSHAENFSYVIGQISAGGYVGEFESGNVANVLESSSILDGLLTTSGSLLSVGNYFVPTIHNSTTCCIPCGGAVRAQAETSGGTKRGMAGGYVGHNEGGQIKGLDRDKWKAADYTGPTSICTADRILSVYGAEYAGGYSGLMECANTAESSNLSILYGLVKAENLLSTLSIVYPFEENTAVYGPLANLDYETWNAWVDYVGKNGGYGAELSQNGKVNSQEELEQKLSKYIYGYQVAAGRSTYDKALMNSGCAGGYVGAMHSGVITNGQAHDVKKVTALKSSGGFAGEVISSGAASLGSVGILGLNLSLDKLLNVADVFVPTIKVSSVQGYQSGLTVETTAGENTNECGNAGGYVGTVIGGQIWGDENTDQNANGGCNVSGLRRVKGSNKVGGFAGYVTSGSLADANTNANIGVQGVQTR